MDRDIDTYIHSVGTSEVSGQIHAPAALSVMKELLVCTGYMAGLPLEPVF